VFGSDEEQDGNQGCYRFRLEGIAEQPTVAHGEVSQFVSRIRIMRFGHVLLPYR
jgi:hypothetical protein